MRHVPNILTLFRILCGPVAAALLLQADSTAHLIALLVLVAAAASDFVDGWIARSADHESDFGRALDPVADKVLVISVLIALAYDGTLGEWGLVPLFVILLRELIVGGLRQVAGDALQVTGLARVKTLLQFAAVLAFAIERLFPAQTGDAALWLLWAAAAVTLITGLDYLIKAMRHG